MKDLKLTYKNEDSIMKEKEYDLIFDFTDNPIPKDMAGATDISATFFGRNNKKFKNINECVDFCKEIMR